MEVHSQDGDKSDHSEENEDVKGDVYEFGTDKGQEKTENQAYGTSELHHFLNTRDIKDRASELTSVLISDFFIGELGILPLNFLNLIIFVAPYFKGHSSLWSSFLAIFILILLGAIHGIIIADVLVVAAHLTINIR